jgi:transcriptional regulator with XRE-family HTH domain
VVEGQPKVEAMTSDYNLPDLMRQARLQAALTQVELAKLMMTGQSTIARWETGRLTSGIATFDKLAEVTWRKLECGWSDGR